MQGATLGSAAGAGIGAATADEDESTLGAAAKGGLMGAGAGGAAGKGVGALEKSDSFEMPSFGGDENTTTWGTEPKTEDTFATQDKWKSTDLETGDEVKIESADTDLNIGDWSGTSQENEESSQESIDLQDEEKQWSDTGMGSYQ